MKNEWENFTHAQSYHPKKKLGNTYATQSDGLYGIGSNPSKYAA